MEMAANCIDEEPSEVLRSTLHSHHCSDNLILHDTPPNSAESYSNYIEVESNKFVFVLYNKN